MKQTLIFLSLFFNFIVASFAQNCIITTIAGGGTGGDGGPATAASLNWPAGIGLDAAGNIYFQEVLGGQVIRKINTSGIISTIAGNGTLVSTAADGGPATNAAFGYPTGMGIAVDALGQIVLPENWTNEVRKIDAAGIITTIAGVGGGLDGGPAYSAGLTYTYSVATDIVGNVYISEYYGGGDIRKINTSGIISTVAGGGGFFADGVPATATSLYPSFVKCDASGNLYISEYYRIRKVNTAGIITTIAGTGIPGYSGDGGLATAAQIRAYDLNVDYAGNVYFADSTSRIRKISPSGIITTIAGNGIAGFSGDGGLANIAQLNYPIGIAFDGAHNMYIADDMNLRLRKISFIPNAVSDSFSVFVDKHCSGANFTVSLLHYHPGFSLKTYFGDGQSDTTSVLSTFGGGYATFDHVYDAPGTYTIKHILMNGTSREDSVTYPFLYTFCRTIPFKFYYDDHGTCIYDSSNDHDMIRPITVEIDSNSVPVDTLSVTNGLYYDAKGSLGDIYSCKVLSAPIGFYVTCPASGVVSDTLQINLNHNKSIGFSCSSTPGFDIGENVSMRTGRHRAQADILVYNNMCTPENAILSMNFSPKYVFESSMPSPSSVTANSISWDFSGISAHSKYPVQIFATLGIPTKTWLTPGDTVNSILTITPSISGDLNLSNNNEIRLDTITGSFDPNEMAVTPGGFINPETQLKYTINFENTGNDTAFNIYVMDTLSDNVDPKTLNILAASSVMNISKFTSNAHTIFKFDFPSINLLDSSHHNQCDGMLMFNINTKKGLPDSTTIFNKAGIFFDYNPAILTNTVENIICATCELSTKSTIKHTTEIFPNPASDVLTIEMNKNAFSSVTIMNEMGQVLIKEQLTLMQTNVDIKMLPAGFYYLNLKGDNGIMVKKFVKK